MLDNLAAALKVGWFVLSQPLLLGFILAATLGIITYNYGFLGFLVLSTNPFFLGLAIWTIGLYFLSRIRPILNGFFKEIQRAFLIWIKKSLFPKLKEGDLGFSPEMEEDRPPNLRLAAYHCLDGLCDALSSPPPYHDEY